jgi:hypothetical protein
MSEHIDKLMFYWYSCKEEDECREAWKEIFGYLSSNWVYLIEWSQFEAFGKYFISPDRKRCIYIGRNLRTDPVTRWVDEIKFNDPAELANKIWLAQKGTVPFKRIQERIREVFGVDVEMSPENKLIRAWFGEASEQQGGVQA